MSLSESIYPLDIQAPSENVATEDEPIDVDGESENFGSVWNCSNLVKI
jgi:hypothetical protein